MDPKQDEKTNKLLVPQKDVTAEPASLEEQHNAKKSRAAVGLVLLAVVILFSIGILGYWLWETKHHTGRPVLAGEPRHEDRAQGAQSSAAILACSAATAAYINQTLGFGFCYPKVWGEPVLANDLFDPADTGSRWILSWNAKPQVKVTLVSTDWSTSAGREGTCARAVQVMDADTFSAAWKTEGSGADITYATRDLTAKANVYHIEEYADNILSEGACLRGYTTINADKYTFVTSSYAVPFTDMIASPKAHIDNPSLLIPTAERQLFQDLVLSVKKV